MTKDQAEGRPKLVGRDRDKVRFEAFEFRKLNLVGAHLALKTHVLHGLCRQRCQVFPES